MDTNKKTYTYDNVLEKYEVQVKEYNDVLYIEGHSLKWMIPQEFQEGVKKIIQDNDLSLNEINPLYVDFSVEVEREISNIVTDELIKGLETNIQGLKSVEDFDIELYLKNINMILFNEMGDELGEFDITECIDNFDNKDGSWFAPDSSLNLLYDTIGDLAQNEDLE